jgi:hypothetical protein
MGAERPEKETAMSDATRELRTRAEILHHRILRGDHQAMGRLRILPRFRKATYEELVPASVRRADCLSVLAAELGFATWTQAKLALTGAGAVQDFGALLCPERCGAHLNLWFRNYADAAAVRETRQGYLLAFHQQYFVVDRWYIESLGLDPADPDWKAMGFDWVRPGSVEARTRLYSKLVARLPREDER